MTSGRAALGALLLAGAGLAPAIWAHQPDADKPALRLDAGSVARNRIVALGRDLVIAGDAEDVAVAVGGSVTVTGRAFGDVIVLGGNARLTATARAFGDVYVLGGRIDAEPGALIAGRSVAYPDASKAWLALVEGPTLGADPWLVLGTKLGLLAFWALVVALLLATSGRELVSTAQSVRAEPFRNFAVGLTGVLAMAMTAVAASALAGAVVGLPLLALVAVFALLLRFWGLVAVFLALGSWILDRTRRGRGVRRATLPVTAACVGLVALGILKLIPWLGAWTWMLATFIGVGAALTTKLGRREAWLNAS